MAATYVSHNPLFGPVAIDEPVITELVRTPEFQRLREIDMAGYSAAFFPGTRHSRYDHSIGVYHLLRSHDACLEEQIFGLLHDISHTVFSHAIDYVLEGGSEEEHSFQDNVFLTFIADTPLPDILRRYGHDPSSVLDESRFTLQERPLPELCADRIDYALRGAFHYGYCSRPETDDYLRHLRRTRDRWHFDSLETARGFAELFSRLDDDIWDHMTSAVMFRTTGDCLRMALDAGYLSHVDFYGTDGEVLNILQQNAAHDEALSRCLRRMMNQVPVKNDRHDYQVVVRCKSRIVDPLFLSCDHTLRKLSEAHPSWKRTVEEGLRPRVYYLKFLD